MLNLEDEKSDDSLSEISAQIDIGLNNKNTLKVQKNKDNKEKDMSKAPILSKRSNSDKINIE